MKINLLAAACLLSASLVIGCDDADKPAAATPATPTMEGAKSSAAEVKAGVEAKTADTVDATKAAAADASSAVTDQAKKLYDQATEAVKGMKLDDAQKYFDQLNALKDKLPADWKTKVDELGKLITDAKAKLSAIPAVPALPK
jgi:hypothetical protein